MNVNTPLVADFIALAIVIVIFLVFCDVVCWHWKINRMVELPESIDATLRKRDRMG